MDSTSTSSRSSGLTETLKTVLYAVLIAVGVRTFLFEPFNIPSGSMEPTLLIGDYLFVSKYSYGYSGKSIFGGLFDFEGRILGSQPDRGDVAVFKLPSDPSSNYIKRIVGLPGDRVQMRDGILYVNNIEAPLERIEDYMQPDRYGRPQPVAQYIEDMPGEVRHRVIHLTNRAPQDNTPIYEVPEGMYFMMGDNRDNSKDSRFSTIGLVPEENLVGRAEIIWFSIDPKDPVWQFWRWPANIRYDRLFDSIR